MFSKKFWVIAAAWPLVVGGIYVTTYVGAIAIYRGAEWIGKALDEEA